MKEATSEASSSVIVIAAVAAFAAFFFSTLWPMIRANFDSNSKCSDAVCGYDCNGKKIDANGNGSITCCYDKTQEMTCPYKG